ncbi:MAG: hypothetical protein V3T05_11015 [Myxococcota bacterium]
MRNGAMPALGDLPLPLWAAAAAAVTAVALVVWVLRRRPWRGARTRFPIVLTHGSMGLDEIGLGSMKQDYCKGVAAHLEELGVEVHRPKVPAARLDRPARLGAGREDSRPTHVPKKSGRGMSPPARLPMACRSYVPSNPHGPPAVLHSDGSQ